MIGAAAFLRSANGILTTDRGHKVAGTIVETSQGPIRIATILKAGMIGFNMVTMLASVVTDAGISEWVMHNQSWKEAVDHFNCISVEGHTSTNDTVLLMANGAATDGFLQGEDLGRVRSAVAGNFNHVEEAQIPADGEGAEHSIEVRVNGAASRDDAKQIAETIAGSNLVKTCVTGNDPNWGRLRQPLGTRGIFVGSAACF